MNQKAVSLYPRPFGSKREQCGTGTGSRGLFLAKGCFWELLETSDGQYIFPFPSLYAGKEKAKSLAHYWLLAGGSVSAVLPCAHARICSYSQAKWPKELHIHII